VPFVAFVAFVGYMHLDGVVAARNSEEYNVAADPMGLPRLEPGSHGLRSPEKSRQHTLVEVQVDKQVEGDYSEEPQVRWTSN
jgi:hypothetical protein